MNVRTGKGRLYAAELVGGRTVPPHVQAHIFDSVGEGWIVAVVFCEGGHGHEVVFEDEVMVAVRAFCPEAVPLFLTSHQNPRPITNLKRDRELGTVQVVLPKRGTYWEPACLNANIPRPEGFIYLAE